MLCCYGPTSTLPTPRWPPDPTHPASRPPSGQRVEVGLGWLLARPPGAAGPVLWHNGGTSGFRSFVAVVREADTAVVVLSNTARSVGRLGQRLLKALSEDAG
jgi:CubicO group peptidase (beta-lactamase class C family)